MVAEYFGESKIAFLSAEGRDEAVLVHGGFKRIITGQFGHWVFWQSWVFIENRNFGRRQKNHHTHSEEVRQTALLDLYRFAVEATWSGYYCLIEISPRNDATKVKSHFRLWEGDMKPY